MSRLKRTKLELRGLLIGIVLGDGNLNAQTANSNARMLIGHSIKQKDYCTHKLSLVAELLRTEYAAKELSVLNKKSGKYYPIFQGQTKSHRYLTKLRQFLYNGSGTKVINQKILKYLTPEGLAYWYMDDGGIITYHKRKKIWGSFISTQNFSYEEHLLIKDYFKSTYNIDCRIGKHGKDKYRISFNNTESKKLFEIIDKYKHKTLAYKFILNYNEYMQEFSKIKPNTVEP